MTDLLSELEMAMWRIDNKPADYASMMSVGFLRTRHAEIAAAVRDAAKWRRHLANAGNEESHFCRQCGLYYTPAPNESEDCPACGFDGQDTAMRAGEG